MGKNTHGKIPCDLVDVCRQSGNKWCPEADLNHRHADFQAVSNGSASIASLENSVKLGSELQSLSDDLSKLNPRVKEAACWLHLNRGSDNQPVIPCLRKRFCLTIVEAIDAAKLAHALDYREATYERH